MNRQAYTLCLCLGLLVVVYSGCTTLTNAQDPDVNTTTLLETVNPLVAQLYLNQKALRTAYLDLRSLAQGAAFVGKDALLNHLQKACLYIDKAQRSAHHQWELLSLLDAIRRERAQDYFTLRLNGLEAAMFESTYDLAFLGTYQAFIDLPAAHSDIERAMTLIRENRTLYTGLIRSLTPLAHPKGTSRHTL